jgi:hypothetical protein
LRTKKIYPTASLITTLYESGHPVNLHNGQNEIRIRGVRIEESCELPAELVIVLDDENLIYQKLLAVLKMSTLTMNTILTDLQKTLRLLMLSQSDMSSTCQRKVFAQLS